MEKKDLQLFFKSRMSEILHKDTLDSFRVRTNNSMTILIELKNVLENWINGNIKHYQTVEYCVNECFSLIKDDECLDFSFYDKDLFKQEIEHFKVEQNKSSKYICFFEAKRLLYYLELCIASNKDCYLTNLVKSIENQFNTSVPISESDIIPTLEKLDKTISAFACELLRRGYSKVYLYSFFNNFKINKSELSFEEAFEELKEKLVNSQKKKYIVVFKLGFSNKKMAVKATSDINNIKDKVPEELSDSIIHQVGYKDIGENVRYYITEKEALDSAMATRLSHDELSMVFDFNLNSIKSVVIPTTALTFCKIVESSQYDIRSEKIFVLDKGNWNDERYCEYNLYERLKIIENTENVSKEVKDRITSAIRHLRIGDYQSEIEQRFINYWIGLEFIFAAASSNESTYERIKKYLIIVSQACYIQRNMKYLNNWLIKLHTIASNEKYWEKDIDSIINSLDDNNILLKYRLKKMKANLHNSESVKNYLKAHKTNLEQHLARIYRLRNELIHEAAIKQDIANVTSNLRSYLVFILNQLVSYFSDDSHNFLSLNMLQFQLMYESFLNLIEKYHSIKYIMDVPLANEYIS